MGCSIAREVIAIFREEDWVERGNAKGEFFLEGLKQLEKKHAIVKEARGRGMELALEFYPRGGFSATTSGALLKRFLVGYYPAGIFSLRPIIEEDILLECLGAVLENFGVTCNPHAVPGFRGMAAW
jgi:adenosylmethionine-8-amino-7-oxononanoate aminotransferase